MDTRKDRGDFYPGGETGGSAPAPQQSDKVDRVNLGEVGESYTLKDVKQKVNQIVRVIAPAAVGLMLMFAGAMGIVEAGLRTRTLQAATAPLEDIPNNSPVVTNEEDAVALATLATATNALQSSTAAAMSELRSDINAASNNVAMAIEGAIAAESNRVEATYAKRSEIPAEPDLSPYALKSELPADYITEGDITNFATRVWINSQGYAREGAVYARIDAQNLALGAATNAQNAAIAAASNRVTAATNKLWQAMGSESNRLDSATNEVWQSALRADETLQREIDALRIVAADSNAVTRLVTQDGTTWQDATGTVWQTGVATGLWTVAHSWTTTGLNWDGPWWWGAEGAGEDYYEGPGWYISSNTLTPMRMSEDLYESEIVVEWSYWDEQDEQEHSITTTCSRMVQWLTNAVDRVLHESDNIAADLTPATNYTDAVAAEFEDGTRQVNFANSAFYADEAGNADYLYDPSLGRVSPSDLIRESTNAAIAVAARKQDALPYPTNAIPYAAISGAPSGGTPEWRVVQIDENTPVSFVTNGIAAKLINGELYATTNGWPDGASMFVRGSVEMPQYDVGEEIRLVGYGTWPTNDFQSVWWRSGATIYVNILVEE